MQQSDNTKILLMLCFMEDESGGIALINALLCSRAQQPKSDRLVEILPIALGGAHGYGEKLFRYISQRRQEEVEKATSELGCQVEVETWLNLDTDRMPSRDTTRQLAEKMACYLTVNRENLEGEALRMILPTGNHAELSHTAYIDMINDRVEQLNGAKGTVNDALKLPRYNKNKHAAEEFFERLFRIYPEYVERYIAENSMSDEPLENLASLLMRIVELYP